MKNYEPIKNYKFKLNVATMFMIKYRDNLRSISEQHVYIDDAYIKELFNDLQIVHFKMNAESEEEASRIAIDAIGEDLWKYKAIRILYSSIYDLHVAIIYNMERVWN